MASCARIPLATSEARRSSPAEVSSASLAPVTPRRSGTMASVVRSVTRDRSPSGTTTACIERTWPTVRPRNSTGAPGSRPRTEPSKSASTSSVVPGTASKRFFRASASEA